MLRSWRPSDVIIQQVGLVVISLYEEEKGKHSPKTSENAEGKTVAKVQSCSCLNKLERFIRRIDSSLKYDFGDNRLSWNWQRGKRPQKDHANSFLYPPPPRAGCGGPSFLAAASGKTSQTLYERDREDSWCTQKGSRLCDWTNEYQSRSFHLPIGRQWCRQRCR